MDAITPNLGLTKPDVGASDDTWGDKLNGNFDILDDSIQDIEDAMTAFPAPPLPAIASPIVEGGAGNVGTSIRYAREDHVHPLGPGISDAPIDSIQYARKNAAWSEVVQQSYGTAHNYLYNAGDFPPPPSSAMRFNNPSQDLTTYIYISYITNDNPSGVNLRTYYLDRVKVGDSFYIQQSDDPTKWKLFKLTASLIDNTTFATLPVVFVAGGTDLSTGRVIVSREGASVASPIGEAPTDGQTYGRKNSAWSILPNITVGTTAPSSPAVNDVWIDTN